MTVSLLRFSNVLGPDIRTPLSKALVAADGARIFGFDPRFQFVHEDDVIQAILFVLEHNLPGVYNVAGDGLLPWSEVAAICGKRTFPLPPFGFRGHHLGAHVPARHRADAGAARPACATGAAVDNRRLKKAGFRYTLHLGGDGRRPTWGPCGMPLDGRAEEPARTATSGTSSSSSATRRPLSATIRHPDGVSGDDHRHEHDDHGHDHDSEVRLAGWPWPPGSTAASASPRWSAAWLIGSVAVLADAAHQGADSLGLLIALTAAGPEPVLAPSHDRSFGWGRGRRPGRPGVGVAAAGQPLAWLDRGVGASGCSNPTDVQGVGVSAASASAAWR